MQGLFGRFGKQQPEQPVVSAMNSRSDSTQSQTEIDDREFPSANRFDDDEETNWDDAETLADRDNPNIYAQPIVPVVAPSPIVTPDLEEWDEALPAATVKNSNIQEVRRSKNAPVLTIPTPQTESGWDESLPSRNFFPSNGADSTPVRSSQVDRAIGLWTVALRQFRRVLPSPLRQLSDAILTVLVVLLVTVSIWIVDGLFVPGVDLVAANQPTAVLANPSGVAVAKLSGSPEQAFIEAIQGQLGDLTSQYSDDLIQALSVDIVGGASPTENRNLLIVQLNPSWYQISDDRQDRVTDRMWLQAKANKFSKLEIQDAEGRSIARSPVVGNHPIILQRR